MKYTLCFDRQMSRMREICSVFDYMCARINSCKCSTPCYSFDYHSQCLYYGCLNIHVAYNISRIALNLFLFGVAHNEFRVIVPLADGIFMACFINFYFLHSILRSSERNNRTGGDKSENKFAICEDSIYKSHFVFSDVFVFVDEQRVRSIESTWNDPFHSRAYKQIHTHSRKRYKLHIIFRCSA